MQSNNIPNQLPDPAVSIDPTLANLLIEVISPEDLEGLDELLHLMPGANLNVTDGTGMLQVQTDQMASISPTQMSSQVPSAQPLLTTQTGSMGQMVQLTSIKQMDVMGQTVKSASKMQMVSIGESGQIDMANQYASSAQPLLPLLMMQSPNASVLAASQFQTGGYASGGTNQDILSENRQLHEENHKLREENQKLCEENQNVVAENQTVVAENSILKKANQNYMKKIHQLELKLKGQVCLHDEMSYIYMVVRKCLISICLS